MSALTLGLLAAVPIVSAYNFPRQNAASSSDLAAGVNQLITQCVIPLSVPAPTGEPEVPNAVDSYVATAVGVSDICPLFGTAVPASVNSEMSSYTSAYSSWANANSAAFSSYGSALYSFQQGARSSSQCSSLYALASETDVPYILTTNTLDSSQIYPSEIFGCTSSGASSGVASSVPASASASASVTGQSSGAQVTSSQTTTGASTPAGSVSPQSTSAAQNTGNAAAATRAPSGVSSLFLYIGGSVAVSALIGMIAL